MRDNAQDSVTTLLFRSVFDAFF